MTFLVFNFQNGNLYFLPEYFLKEISLHRLFSIPTAWSISLEIYFYLIAPFIVRKKRLIFMLLALSLLLRGYLHYIDLFEFEIPFSPYFYAFFPVQLTWFLLGVLGYYAYRKIKKIPHQKSTLKIIYYSVLGLIVLYSFLPAYTAIPYYFYIKRTLFLLYFSVCLPFLFLYSKGWRRDRKIGELSYIIYITHAFVIDILQKAKYLTPSYKLNGIIFPFLVLGATLILSFLLNKFIQHRLESYRQRRVQKN